ncbi:hypothetical protein, partial [Yersinia aleksiciae]|uniref:hypothetical protein n=1 Tax=Yersinia aleksiciae TaxID=263819 RepID=UPI0022FEAC20
MRSAFIWPLTPQPPRGLQARNPLGTPALAHVSLAHFVGTLGSSYRWRDGVIRNPLLKHTSTRRPWRVALA